MKRFIYLEGEKLQRCDWDLLITPIHTKDCMLRASTEFGTVVSFNSRFKCIDQ